MATGIEAQQLLLLLNWMSPAFPIGSFAYSHGLEWAIDEGLVHDEATTRDWINEIITKGSGWNDAVIFSNAVRGEDVNDLALALCSSQERFLETTQLGAAFQIAASAFAPRSGEKEGARRESDGKDEGPLAYTVAAALACKSMSISSHHALLAFLQGFSNALISVAVRLVPIGQTAGLNIMRDLLPVIAATAERAARSTLDDLGSSAFMSDIAAMKHETLQPRIFCT
ncbi:MAG: urease accessory UreF family protein [Aestuariivirga sp.]